MLQMGSRRWLSIVVEPAGLALAEYQAGKGRVDSPRTARFVLPSDWSWEKPAEAGRQLADFLKQQRFHNRHVVVGLPGRWVLAKSRLLPPAAPAALPAMLQLMVEREYHTASKEWVFDYLHEQTPQNTSVLLAAAPSAKIQQLTAVLTAAGLTPVAMTPALLSVLPALLPSEQNVLLHAGVDGLELILRKQGRVLAAQRLVASAEADQSLKQDVDRLLAMHAMEAELLCVHDVRETPWSEAQWQARLGRPVRLVPVWNQLGSPAALLAKTWKHADAGQFDFMHSRMAARQGQRITRVHVLAACAVLAVLVFMGYSAFDWFDQWRDVQRLQRELAALQPQLEVARGDVDRLRLARGWYDARPALLDALRAVTLAFPTDGQVWTTNLTLRDDLTATLTCKAVDQQAAIRLLETLRNLPAFDDVQLRYSMQAQRTSGTVSFALNFVYTGKEER